jgi:hypothetical protein
MDSKLDAKSISVPGWSSLLFFFAEKRGIRAIQSYSKYQEVGHVFKGTKATSLDFLRAVYMNAELPLSVRMRAAGMAIPYEYPKLSVVASVNDPERFAERLERAIQRSGVKLIEHEPAKSREIEEPPQTDLAKPMTTSAPDRRMRRV